MYGQSFHVGCEQAAIESMAVSARIKAVEGQSNIQQNEVTLKWSQDCAFKCEQENAKVVQSAAVLVKTGE